jgi:succinyl-CoA synthetase beta subunit
LTTFGIAERIAARDSGGVTINVSGGISTSAEIGKSVVDAINQYTQVYGPVRFAEF